MLVGTVRLYEPPLCGRRRVGGSGQALLAFWVQGTPEPFPPPPPYSPSEERTVALFQEPSPVRHALFPMVVIDLCGQMNDSALEGVCVRACVCETGDLLFLPKLMCASALQVCLSFVVVELSKVAGDFSWLKVRRALFFLLFSR